MGQALVELNAYAAFTMPVAAIRLTMTKLSSAGGLVTATRGSDDPLPEAALGDPQPLDRERRNLCGIFDAGLTDLDNLLCYQFGEGIVAILEAEGH